MLKKSQIAFPAKGVSAIKVPCSKLPNYWFIQKRSGKPDALYQHFQNKDNMLCACVRARARVCVCVIFFLNELLKMHPIYSQNN